jgi:hypothetical protein
LPSSKRGVGQREEKKRRKEQNLTLILSYISFSMPLIRTLRSSSTGLVVTTVVVVAVVGALPMQ